MVDLVFSNFRVIDDNGNILIADSISRYKSFREIFTENSEPPIGNMEGRATFGELLKANFIGTSSVVCRRQLFDRVGSFDESLAEAMLSGRPFIVLDNFRGDFDSPYLEHILTAADGVRVQYVEIMSYDSLERLEGLSGRILVAIAAHVGSTRLIDNTILGT